MSPLSSPSKLKQVDTKSRKPKGSTFSTLGFYVYLRQHPKALNQKWAKCILRSDILMARSLPGYASQIFPDRYDLDQVFETFVKQR